tara:strand:- start:1353 stop:1553 length:201 start_codon:yes stop_codon:yes gene_type:complete
MRQRENLTKEQIRERLYIRQEFLLGEMYAADRLDGWNLKGISEELKSIRLKLKELGDNETDPETNS